MFEFNIFIIKWVFRCKKLNNIRVFNLNEVYVSNHNTDSMVVDNSFNSSDKSDMLVEEAKKVLYQNGGEFVKTVEIKLRICHKLKEESTYLS